MMKIHMMSLNRAIAVAAVTLVFAQLCSAANISINFTGMNLMYDGSALYDATSTAGGSLDPSDADPLTTVNFFLDGNLQGTISSDVFLDVFIPDVTGISSAANTVFNTTTVGNPGYFDLLIGSPVVTSYLALDLEEVNVSYVDVSGTVQFTFGAAIADSATQSLPFGLIIGEPVTVSFSAQVTPGTRTTGGGFVTGFKAAGTGEFNGPAIPEPATVALLGLGGLAGVSLVRRHRR